MREDMEDIIGELIDEIRFQLRDEGIATLFVQGFTMLLVSFVSYKFGVCNLICLTTRDWLVMGTLYVGLIVAKWFQIRFYRLKRWR